MPRIKQYGRMWARNSVNLGLIPKHGEGIYVLYDGSTPVYIGMGNIRKRLEAARKSKRRGQLWDYFSWYITVDPGLNRDIEALLLNMLPFYLRVLNRMTGKLPGKFRKAGTQYDEKPETINRTKLPPR